jgi:hypothetical protein
MAISEVTMKVVVSPYKRYTEPGCLLKIWMNTTVKFWSLGTLVPGREGFCNCPLQAPDSVTSATNSIGLTRRFTGFSNLFQQRDPPYGMSQCQHRVARTGITAFRTSLPAPVCYVRLVRHRGLSSEFSWLTSWPTSPNICHKQTIQICVLF